MLSYLNFFYIIALYLCSWYFSYLYVIERDGEYVIYNSVNVSQLKLMNVSERFSGDRDIGTWHLNHCCQIGPDFPPNLVARLGGK